MYGLSLLLSFIYSPSPVLFTVISPVVIYLLFSFLMLLQESMLNTCSYHYVLMSPVQHPWHGSGAESEMVVWSTG
jgi:hypothetical protein